MATKDERPSLLSKVALFVRNPTKDWSELDRPSQRDDAGYDKQALQAMIERKRQNDFVRRREFDHLRKLRNRNQVDFADSAVSARTSYFQNSFPTDQDGRAVTLKKIDEIEAQMSKQWWKGKTEQAQMSAAARARADTVPLSQLGSTGDTKSNLKGASAPQADPYGPTEPFPLQQPAPGSLASMSPNSDVGPGSSVPEDYSVTQMSDAFPGMGMPQPLNPQAALAGRALDFSVSRLFETQPAELIADPELEEAAIRFANGDFDGAEKSLLDALAGADVSPANALAWASALLDLYRVTHRRVDFDRAAARYFDHLDGAHPVWFCIGLGADASEPLPQGSPVWEAPAFLGLSDMQSLQSWMASYAAPWNLNWSGLRSIEVAAVGFLDGLFSSLCNEAVSARFAGIENLRGVVQQCTADAEPGFAPIWWQLRFNVLRAVNDCDGFQHAAIEYCVAQASEAPVWTDPACRIETVAPSEMQGDGPVTAPMRFSEEDGLSALRGEILGDASDVLRGVQDLHSTGDLLLIGCSELQRVDFAAAGSILNWVVARQSEGRQVQFHNANSLVAAFFNVIGIAEHARVNQRSI
jgi:ABC-type transporter Mla MlaB component